MKLQFLEEVGKFLGYDFMLIWIFEIFVSESFQIFDKISSNNH